MSTLPSRTATRRRLTVIKDEFPRVELGMGVEAQIMEITPDLATEWIADSLQIQRPMSKPMLDMLNRLINDDKWCFNGATIIFDEDGRLSDGKTRLTACKETGKPIIALVLWGVPNNAFWTMDASRPRSGADAIHARSLPSKNILAAAAQLLWRYQHDLSPTHSGYEVKLAPMEIDEIVQQNPGILACVSGSRPGFKITGSNGVCVFCHFLFSRISEPDANLFFEKLGSGVNLDKNSPILHLRNVFIDRKNNHTMVFPLEKIHLLFEAWNLFRKHKKIRSLKVNTADTLPDLV